MFYAHPGVSQASSKQLPYPQKELTCSTPSERPLGSSADHHTTTTWSASAGSPCLFRGQRHPCPAHPADLDGNGGPPGPASAHLRRQPPGSGKTAVADDVRTAGVRVRADTRRRQAAALAHARAHRFGAVIETALGDADVEDLRAAAAAVRRDGTRLGLVTVAASLAHCQAGTLARFLDGALHQEGGRFVSWDNLDTCAQRLLRNLTVVEDEQLVHQMPVVRRDFALLYDNELTGESTWRRRPADAQAVATEQVGPWTAREATRFLQGLALSERLLRTTPIPEGNRLAVQRDVTRATALAELLRRRARATRTAPAWTTTGRPPVNTRGPSKT
ncbi:zeta toxin family protein [Streptomyces sp. NPDC015345]|uniref:zeta toxin family protein n=1 Tax=Streptomyces sp. NPDC015345 TaxID=3364953 RepID=UPI0036F8BE42